MKQSFIAISQLKEEELQAGLMDFANLYAQEEFAQQIEVFRKKGELEYLVVFPNEPDFLRFSFAVNYVRYLNPKSPQKPDVAGYFNSESERHQKPFLNGEFVKVYVSEGDGQHDNVNIITSDHETYFFDFNLNYKKVTTAEARYDLPAVDLNDYNYLITIIPAPSEEKPWWKFW
ncbi:hypothetical protein [Flavobacterium selenitireducens]|uniref:hypothetical protein n=1 Tax=Flavobacterium selenitireducens TaxID=2722704 RepID=UPI00168AA2DE|nr:hypothetical protein [Flavobacterium selenitireducens]MBD3583977.1 hypothetical protein [Flavobacterium selenitireducens]